MLLAEVYAKTGSVLPENPHLRLIDLAEWLLRLPARTCRQTHLSDVLHRKILSPYEINGIRQIRMALESGHDVRSYLGDRTRSVRNRRNEKRTRKAQNDLFFSDWGLHHFHLGADLAGMGRRVMRSFRVLIAHLTESDAYFLDVLPHGKGFSDLWGRVELLEILQRNWPVVLARYELRGMYPRDIESRHLASDYVRLRQSGISSILGINGKAFMGPGLGIATDCSSTKAVDFANGIQRELHQGEQLFRQQHPDVEALLFVRKDATVGFFVPESDTAYGVFLDRSGSSKVTSFFKRLIEETGILEGLPDDAIWTAPALADSPRSNQSPITKSEHIKKPTGHAPSA